MLEAYIIIFLLAAIPFFEVLAIVPIAIMGGMPVIPTMIIAFSGNFITIILLIMFVDRVKEWRRKREGTENQNGKRQVRAKNLWTKYGLPGLAVLGPFFVGTHLSAFMSIILGGSKRNTLYWITTSLVSWTLIMGMATYYGFDFMNGGEKSVGFLSKYLKD